jgi:hypothetical protein
MSRVRTLLPLLLWIVGVALAPGAGPACADDSARALNDRGLELYEAGD